MLRVENEFAVTPLVLTPFVPFRAPGARGAEASVRKPGGGRGPAWQVIIIIIIIMIMMRIIIIIIITSLS